MSTSAGNWRATMRADVDGARAAGMTGPIDRVSVIVPLLNEADHVEHLVEEIAAQDFSGPLEVLVADGGSTDDSVARLKSAAERAGLDLTVLTNPTRLVSSALNACIERAR